ncbi:spore cortex biosynthesis protein YabQ [Bacillus sp. 165]|uniref:spore cortex biosynthesis protein YabQ n=1 Tax=Bacillus sp. 165 TaxID=1529117 RepID=UPI001ADBA6CC|nr:spore cortex biosynthesis protein YabQ [Bacillus sp. 165]MBO9131310.1 spore cortex biosynthesis protein YabQ [Bacillus sp. 165]
MSLTVQFYTMLSMIGMGAWVGVALDTYQRFLKRSTRKKWIVFIHDILFWIVQALIVFYTLLLMNEAELRFYVFIALACGFAAYQSLLKAWYIRILERIIYICIQTYLFLAKLVKVLIIRPILFLVQVIVAILLFLIKFIQKICFFIFKILKKISFILFKIVAIPLQFIGHLLWKILPVNVKIFIRKYAGILQKTAKLKETAQKWWQKIKKLGGPRK